MAAQPVLPEEVAARVELAGPDEEEPEVEEGWSFGRDGREGKVSDSVLEDGAALRTEVVLVAEDIAAEVEEVLERSSLALACC